jgi:hypothetical protein
MYFGPKFEEIHSLQINQIHSRAGTGCNQTTPGQGNVEDSKMRKKTVHLRNFHNIKVRGRAVRDERDHKRLYSSL